VQFQTWASEHLLSRTVLHTPLVIRATNGSNPNRYFGIKEFSVNAKSVNRRFAAVVSIAVACSNVLGPIAVGAELAPVGQKVVHLGDLNLDREEGIAVLFSRVRTAAKEVCEAGYPRDMALTRRPTRCVADATARAVIDINLPAVTSYYRTRVAMQR
jgi:UrcA family protein